MTARSVFRVRVPTEDALLELARSHGSTHDLTYADHGATLRGVRPAGFEHDEATVDLGHGDRVWDAAAAALDAWAVHRGAGLRVGVDGPPTAGRHVAVGAPLPGRAGAVVAVCRVVATVDDGVRRGFAYGTLPLHPEEGEEAFVVERDGDAVSFRVVAFSRRRHPVVRLGGPVSKAVQRATLHRYLAAMRAAVGAG